MTDERIYNLVDDKAKWGAGPWVDEPDKVVWVDDATGLDCMILRNHSGALCGYVGVPEGHPWHGQDYDNVDAEVHGGLTFAGPCQSEKSEDEQAICHNPAGRPDNVWWLGFDCVHLWDLAPAHTRVFAEVGRNNDQDVYRDIAYVKSEVGDLAQQAADATEGAPA